MTRHALAVVAALLALLALLAMLALWPPSTQSDQPVSAVVPASAFVNITPGAIGRQACRLGADAGCSLSARPASRTPSPTLPTAPVATITSLDKAPAGTAIFKGTASWFDSPIGVSAAGPALRTALGSGWRGTRVTVCGPAGCAVTVLGDWMRADRLIDLDVSVFPAVCGPLSLGLCQVEVTW